MWRETKRLPTTASTSLLFVCACGRRYSISRLASQRLPGLRGGGPDKRPKLPQDFLLSNIKSRHQLPVSSGDIHAVIDQACHYGVDIPDSGVKVLHPLQVPGINFLYFEKDPSPDILWNSVQEGS